ncbi:LysO family transporter (plasmid) [Pseudomonas sp. JZ134]
MLEAPAGVALASLFISMPIHEVLAVGSGLSWYTQSGTLLTQNVRHGSIFKRSVSRRISPTAQPADIKVRFHPCRIGISGSTALDVKLQVIDKHSGAAYIPFALPMIGITTLAVPLLIPFFYHL